MRDANPGEANEEGALDILKQPRFANLDDGTPRSEGTNGALRRLLSLQDVVLERAQISCRTDVVESYSMHLDLAEAQGRGKIEDKERTFIVKRMDITFNEKECQLLNFTDITSYKRLKKQEEINRLLKTLNTSVHHEMLAPLKANMEISMRLFK